LVMEMAVVVPVYTATWLVEVLLEGFPVLGQMVAEAPEASLFARIWW
jgi:hypothetical protein